MSATLERLLRFRLEMDFVIVVMEGRLEEEEVEVESDKEEEEFHALAQCEMARSTMVERAPSRPPMTEELELELDDDEDDELEDTDSGRGVRGGEGGSPR